MTDDELPWELLDSYFSGECSDATALEVGRWEAADPVHARELALLREVWERSGARSRRFDVDGAWRAVREQMHSEGGSRPAPAEGPRVAGSSEPAAASPSRRPRMPATLLRVAAVVLLLIASGAMLVRFAASGRNAGEPPAARFVTSAPGQRVQVRLPDGSLVVLSAASSIRIPDGYGREERRVDLESGEAFFRVSHDAAKPFRVHVSGAVAEDLGTEFVLRAGDGETGAQVVVAEGLVSLRSETARADSAVELSPGQRGVVSEDGTVVVDTAVDVDARLAWLRGRLVFHQAPLPQVLRDLERWYGVTLRLADPALAAVPVTATFGTRDFDEVLASLLAALDVRSTRSGQVIWLVPAAP